MSTAHVSGTVASSIAVVIPTHRDRGFLTRAVESVQSQLRDGDRIWICANGCSDDYWAALGRLESRSVSLARCPGRGIAHARNYGIGVSSSEFVVFLDDDDEIFPGALERLRSYLNQHPDVVAVTGGVDAFGRESWRVGDVWDVHGTRIELADLMGAPPTPSMGSAVLRRNALVHVGLLDESVAPADDWDLWIRLGAHGHVVGLNVPTLQYRLHENNASNNAVLMARMASIVFKRHEHLLPLSTHRQQRIQAFQRVNRWYTPRLVSEAAHQAARGRLAAAMRSLWQAARLNVQYLRYRFS